MNKRAEPSCAEHGERVSRGQASRKRQGPRPYHSMARLRAYFNFQPLSYDYRICNCIQSMHRVDRVLFLN